LPNRVTTIDAEVGGHLLDHRVALGVDRERRAAGRRRGSARSPAHCSKVLGPRPGTSRSAARDAKPPWVWRCATIFLASAGPMPGDVAEQAGAGGVEIDADVVDAALDDVAQLLAQSGAWTSCWYWPTPMALGSTFTSSASGSCRRRAIEIAPRIVRSRSGNSSRARSDAL
jgi:hypothetical protein